MIDPEYARDRKFSISWSDLSETRNIRDLKSELVGKLTGFTGTVTKTSEVRPELISGSFNCDLCGAKVVGIEQQFRYTQPMKCSNRICTNTNRFTLDEAFSFYGDWQKLRVQEPTKEMSSGVLPRSLDVIVRGDTVDTSQPGDDAIFVGTLLSVPFGYSLRRPGEKFELTRKNTGVRKNGQMSMQGITGVKNFGSQDLNYRFIFLANNIIKRNSWLNKADAQEEETEISEEDQKLFKQMSSNPKVLECLANQIAPNIWGSLDIKKGILLMLFGGVTKYTSDGMKLRGDINLCIVGDPSTAKSQFLKFIHTNLPRCVYANGKGTTAAGLTAAVTRDSETNEFGIEAGALILADNGICCIDEFDKIDEKDTSAIHEAMEQQTISITKAGIQATLNSRTAILAALNPRYGRYDKSKSLKMNVNMAPPLMSRFDMIFVVTDDCDDVRDFAVAKHILTSHKKYASDYIKYEADTNDQEVPQEEPSKSIYNLNTLLRFLKVARTLEPQMQQEAADELLKYYLEIRDYASMNSGNSYNITVRQLESMIRIAEAIARVHMMKIVTVGHVRESARLLRNSLLQIKSSDIQIEEEIPLKEQVDRMSISQPIEEENAIKIGPKIEKKSPVKTQKTLKITKQEFLKLSENILTILKTNRSSQRKSQLINKMYLLGQNELNSMEVKGEYYKKVNAAINTMLKKDKRIVRMSSKQDKDPLINLHFNLQ